MKSEYWILYNGKEVIRKHEKTYPVGTIMDGYCSLKESTANGTFIVFDDNLENYKNNLLKFLIKREEITIANHLKKKEIYEKVLLKK